MSNFEKGTTKKVLGKIALKNGAQFAAAILILAALWAVAYFAVGNELLVPSFEDCWAAFWNLWKSAGFISALFGSFLRVLIAFLISFVLAAIFAVIAYLVPAFCRIFSMIVVFLRTAPTMAVLLIILVWTSAGVAPVIVAFLSLFPMLYTAILTALSGVDENLVEMSRVYNVPLKKRIFQLYLPAALPYVMREAGAALSFSLKLVVSAEVLAATYKSLGGMMQEAKVYLDVPLLFALVGVTFLLGAAIELLGSLAAHAVERRVK